MTTNQEVRLNMYLASEKFLIAGTAIANSLPNFSTNFAAFQAAILKIQKFAEAQKLVQTGNARSKNAAKLKLTELAADCSRKLTAYATFKKDLVMLEKVKISESALKKATDTGLRDRAQILYDQAQPLVADLEIYGITAASQTALLDAITAYVETIAAPRAGTNETSQATQQLATAFAEADEALENIDTAVEIIKLTERNFYNGYKAARKLVQTSSGKIAVKGLVTDTAGNPLKGVSVLFSLNGQTGNAALLKKTFTLGGFRIKAMAPGIYKVTVSKTGYVEQVLEFPVAEGEMNVLNVMLAKK